jgi:hypothetical protein
MANQHAVAVGISPAVTISAAVETVVATLTPFSENQSAGAFGGPGLGAPNPNPGPQGVVIDGNFNLLIGTAGTAVVARIRYGSLTGALIAGFPAGGLTVPALGSGTTLSVPVFALDPTLVETNAVYVVTFQVTGGTGTHTVNYGILTAMDATSFE